MRTHLERPLLVALIALQSLGCECDTANEAGSAVTRWPRRENIPFVLKLLALNRCESDGDCEDFGYVCSVGCHVAISRKLKESAADAWGLSSAIWWNDPCDAEAEGRSCGPFFGLTCDRGRCVARSFPPRQNICWALDTPARPPCRRHRCDDSSDPRRAPEFVRADCLSVLTKHARHSDCRDYCDGANPRGQRLRGCADSSDGSASCFVVDYVDCRTCLSSRASAGVTSTQAACREMCCNPWQPPARVEPRAQAQTRPLPGMLDRRERLRSSWMESGP